MTTSVTIFRELESKKPIFGGTAAPKSSERIGRGGPARLQVEAVVEHVDEQLRRGLRDAVAPWRAQCVARAGGEVTLA